MTSILSHLVSTVKSVLLPAAVNSVPAHPHPYPSCDRDRDAHINYDHNHNHHAHTHTHTHTHLHSHACTDPSNHTNTNTTSPILSQQLTSKPSIDNPTVIPPTEHHRSQHQHQHLSLPVPTFVATSPPSHSHSHGCSSSPSSSSSSSSLSLPPLPPSDRSLSCHHHSVQFYESDAYLIHSVVDLIETGLRTGDAVIIIATSQHNTSMEQALIKRGVDPHIYQKNQQLYLLDAHQTLAAFARRHEKEAIPTSIESITTSLAHHSTDPVKFDHVIGDLLRRTLTRFPRVGAYGEMVALLMAQKNVSATIELEEFWNGLQATLPFSLLCGYPLAQFRTETIITSTEISTPTSTSISTSTYTKRTELDMPSPSPSPCPSLTASPCHELSASPSPSPSLMCPTPPPPPAFFHQICACHSFVLPDEQYLKIKDTEHELRQIQYMEYRNKQYDRGSARSSSSSSSNSNSSLSSSSSPESPITSTHIIPTPTLPWTSTSDNESDNAAVELSSTAAHAIAIAAASSSSSSATRTRLTRSRTRRRTRIHTPSSRHAEHPRTRACSTTSSMHPSVPSFTTASPSLSTPSALSCTPSDPSTSTSTSTLSRQSRSSNKRRRSSRTSISSISSLSTSSLSPSSSPSPTRDCESAISPRLSPSPSPPSKRMRLRMRSRMRLRMRSRMRRSSIPIPNPRHHMRIHEDSAAASISISRSKFSQFQGRTILVTEDNLINSKIICAMLRRLGLDTIVAWNGSECVRMVAKHQHPIHAILMDLQMPVMNGLDATRAIRALDSSLAQIPIIALTANVLDQDRTACRAAGMSGFIAKPVTMHHLTEQLSNALQVQTGEG